MSKDYVFHVNWEDRYKQPYRVGILAQIDNIFYLILKNEESAKAAYNSGYDGVPGYTLLQRIRLPQGQKPEVPSGEPLRHRKNRRSGHSQHRKLRNKYLPCDTAPPPRSV